MYFNLEKDFFLFKQKSATALCRRKLPSEIDTMIDTPGVSHRTPAKEWRRIARGPPLLSMTAIMIIGIIPAWSFTLSVEITRSTFARFRSE